MTQKNKSVKKKVVRVIAPGFRPHPEVLKTIAQFIDENAYFDFLYDKKMMAKKHPLNSADCNIRFKYLKLALEEEQSDVIWCLRGGYGSIQLLPFLDSIKQPKKKKLLIGLSDITSLHIYLQQRWGWSTLHASHLDRWIEGKLPKRILKENLAMILKWQSQVEFKRLRPVNELAKKTKKIQGEIVGGNLVTLTSHTGTPYEIQAKGKFLFIEEIGERAYRIDRCLEQLHLAGVFRGCKGLLIGQMTQCLELDKKNLLPWLWKQWGERLSLPIFTGIETGHDIYQRPLPLNTPAVVKKKGDLFTLSVENNE